jgi:hypothetical protein
MNMANESKQRKTRALMEFPEGWALGEPEIATFRKYNPTASDADIALQWEKFEAHHLALGSRFKLWPQAWRTWGLNHAEYAFRRVVKDPIGFGHNFGNTPMDNLMREHSGSRRNH